MKTRTSARVKAGETPIINPSRRRARWSQALGAITLLSLGAYPALRAALGETGQRSLRREEYSSSVRKAPPSSRLASSIVGDEDEATPSAPSASGSLPVGEPGADTVIEPTREVHADGTVLTSEAFDPADDATADLSPPPPDEVVHTTPGAIDQPPPGHTPVDPRPFGYASVEALEAALARRLKLPKGKRLHVWSSERDGRRGISISILSLSEAEL